MKHPSGSGVLPIRPLCFPKASAIYGKAAKVNVVAFSKSEFNRKVEAYKKDGYVPDSCGLYLQRIKFSIVSRYTALMVLEK